MWGESRFIVGATTVLSSLGKPGVVVVDARDKTFYDGTATGSSHERKHRTGHIAGALSIRFDSVFDDQLVLRSPDELKERFTKAGVAPGDTVIGYCHIGQQATAMLFAARRLGHPVLLYDGSCIRRAAGRLAPRAPASAARDRRPVGAGVSRIPYPGSRARPAREPGDGAAVHRRDPRALRRL